MDGKRLFARVLGGTLLAAVLATTVGVAAARNGGERYPSAAGAAPVPAADGLATAPEQCPDYDREDRFGSMPKTVRAAVLAKAGGVDVYTGGPLPAKWEADHVVALHEAMCSGLRPADEQRFYTDVANLVATAPEVNRAKSDLGPGEVPRTAAQQKLWPPTEPAVVCFWILTWRDVKVAYQLTVDPDEAAWVRAHVVDCAAP